MLQGVYKLPGVVKFVIIAYKNYLKLIFGDIRIVISLYNRSLA